MKIYEKLLPFIYGIVSLHNTYRTFNFSLPLHPLLRQFIIETLSMTECSVVFSLLSNTVPYFARNSMQNSYIHNMISFQEQNKARTNQFSASTGGFIMLRTAERHNYSNDSCLNIHQVHFEIPLSNSRGITFRQVSLLQLISIIRNILCIKFILA